MEKATYHHLAYFLSGYLCALSDIDKASYNAELSKWVSNERSSLEWSNYILIVQAKNDEHLAYKLLFECIKKFINEKSCDTE